MRMLRGTKQIGKPKISVRQAARELGCSWGHLSRVISGERRSAKLSRALHLLERNYRIVHYARHKEVN